MQKKKKKKKKKNIISVEFEVWILVFNLYRYKLRLINFDVHGVQKSFPSQLHTLKNNDNCFIYLFYFILFIYLFIYLFILFYFFFVLSFCINWVAGQLLY